MRCEHNHRWPRTPKPQHVNSAPQANHLRPICLLSHIYKLWVSLRLPLFRVAMDQMPSNIVGGRRGVHIHRLAAEINLDLDVAEASGLTLYGCHCDVTKAYEGAQHTQLEHCLQRHGIPGEVRSLLLAVYGSPKYLKFDNTASMTTLPCRAGLAAGCPAAIYCLSMLTEPLVRRLNAVEGLSSRAYMDDVTLWTKTPLQQPQG
eukprot:2104100-Amphidinium_carterae.1